MQNEAKRDDEWAERHEMVLCACGHDGYLHDDGLDACVSCWCEGEAKRDHSADCQSHRPVRLVEVA